MLNTIVYARIVSKIVPVLMDLHFVGRHRKYTFVRLMLRRKIKLGKEENAILDRMSGMTSLTI